jgi:hypothetical protein
MEAHCIPFGGLQGSRSSNDSCMTNSRPPLTGPQALGTKEYCYRGGKIRKVHRKRHHQTASVKWLNYSDPLPTIQERGYLQQLYQRHQAGGPRPE